VGSGRIHGVSRKRISRSGPIITSSKSIQKTKENSFKKEYIYQQ